MKRKKISTKRSREPAQNTQKAAGQKAITRDIFWRNFSVRAKTQFALFIVANVAMITVGLLGYFSARKILVDVTFDRLAAIREAKSYSISSYFDNLRKQIITLSESRMIIEAVYSFKNAAIFLENDFYGDVSPDSMLISLNRYYNREFLPRWQEISQDKKLGKDDFMINNTAALKLQYHYIAANPYPVGAKAFFEKANDGSLYSDVHGRYHKIFRSYLEEMGFEDMFLLNAENGEVMYSVSKEIDYMSSLLDGPHRESSLADAFRQAKNTPFKNFSVLTDFKKYHPSYDVPSAFIASPIFDQDKKVGVLVLQISIDEIDRILSSNQQWELEGLGSSGEVFLLGEDFKMRSNPRMFKENPEAFFKMLRNNYSEDEVESIRRYGTSVLLQEVKTEAGRRALQGITEQRILSGYQGNKVLSAYSYLDLEGVNWAILVEIAEEEAFANLTTLRNNILFVMFFVFLCTFLLSSLYSRWFTQPIKTIRHILQKLSLGEQVEKITAFSDDEIGQTFTVVNRMIVRFNNITAFIHAIRSGNFSHKFEVFSKKDEIGNALIGMRDHLKKVEEEDKRRNWVSEGSAKFAEILRRHNHDMDELADKALYFIIEYLKLEQGAIYLLKSDKQNDEEYLEMRACYAYARKKILNQRIAWGQGVVSQCWQDKALIYMDDVPPSYPHIKTGLIEMDSKSVLLVPILINHEVYGVIELLSIQKIPKYKQSFTKRLAGNIASTIFGQVSYTRTQELIKESEQLKQRLSTEDEKKKIWSSD